MSVKYTMTQRKPFPVYEVSVGEREAVVMKSEDDGVRSKRWQLIEEGNETLYFSSRRAAFYFFEIGERFKTKPVYAGMRGGGSKRIR